MKPHHPHPHKHGHIRVSSKTVAAAQVYLIVEVELSTFLKDMELDIPCFMGLASCIVHLMLQVGTRGLQGSCGCAPMRPCWLVISGINVYTQCRYCSISYAEPKHATNLFSLQGIESTALLGEYLDIDRPCSLIAVIMKNSKPKPSLSLLFLIFFHNYNTAPRWLPQDTLLHLDRQNVIDLCHKPHSLLSTLIIFHNRILWRSRKICHHDY